MAKRRRPRTTRARRSTRSRPTKKTSPPFAPEKGRHKWLPKPLAWLWSAIGVIATTTAFSLFWPSVTIEPKDFLDQSNAFSAPFEVTNDSNFAIHAVTTGCTVMSANFGELTASDNRIEYGQAVPQLRKGERDTLWCPLTPTFIRTGPNVKPLDAADLIVRVEFRPSFWPTRTMVSRRFTTTKDVDGKLRWMSRPAP
jgi:hypothetical protein